MFQWKSVLKRMLNKRFRTLKYTCICFKGFLFSNEAKDSRRLYSDKFWCIYLCLKRKHEPRHRVPAGWPWVGWRMLAGIKYAESWLDAMQGCILLAPGSPRSPCAYAVHISGGMWGWHGIPGARRHETMWGRRDYDDKYCDLGSQKIIQANTRTRISTARSGQLLQIC